MKVCIFSFGMALPKGYRHCGICKIALETSRLLMENGFKVETITFGEEKVEKPKELKMHVLPGKFGFRNLIRLIALLHRLKPDIVHAFGEINTAILIAICGKIIRKPTVVTISRGTQNDPSPIVKYFEIGVISLLDRIIFLDSYTSNTDVFKEIPRRKKITLKNGVEDIFFKSDRSKIDENLVLYWGDALYERGLDTALYSFKEILNKVPKASLLAAIRSYGHLQYIFCTDDKLSKLIFELMERGKLRFIFQPYPEGIHIKDIISKASVVVLPFKINPVEPPLTLLESMAMGKAIVTTSVGSITNIIKNFENGLVIAPGDSSQLAKSVVRLLADETLRRKIGKTARQYVMENYTWQNYLKGLSLLYEELTHEKRLHKGL